MAWAFAISEHFGLDSAALAACGGALLGSTVVFKTLLTGHVLGVSGTTRGLLLKPRSSDRAAFVLGLAAAGGIMAAAYGGFEPIPVEHDATRRAVLRVRFLVGGLLVGLGSAFGNGCTSGHGLTGLARLTLRSWVAVPTFMAAGAAAACLSATSDWLPPDGRTEEELPGVPAGAAVSAGAAAVLLLGGAAAWRWGRKLEAWKAVALAECLSGLAFGCGLVVSGMARPSKVAAFLDLRSGAWDPSLAFVMGSALLLTFPFFQALERRTSAAPLLVGESFALPPASAVPDLRLVLGSATFGVGWGLCGACPGPIWVMLIPRMSLEVAALAVGMLAGMGVWVAWNHGKGACRWPALLGGTASPGATEAAAENGDAGSEPPPQTAWP